MKLEVAYASTHKQYLIALDLPAPQTVASAIEASQLLLECQELNLSQAGIGIFSQKASLTTLLNDGDRVEIYRGLLCDPKVKRRERAKAFVIPA